MPFLPDILPCIVGGFFWRKVPRVPCPSRSPSVRPVRSHSLPVAPARPSAPSALARCEPFPAFPLLPGSSTCPAWPSAASASARCEPFSANRLTPVSRDSGFWPGTMAAGAREQAASCDAFVLSRRLPAPDAPSNRTSTACLVAKPVPEPRPGLWLSRDCHRGTPAGAWNNAVRTRGVFTHRDDFQKLACVERGLVRTARGGTDRADWRRKAQVRERLQGQAGKCKLGQVRERGETKRRKPERTEDGGARRTETDGGPGGLGRCAWRDDVGNGNEPSQRGTDRDRRAQERASWRPSDGKQAGTGAGAAAGTSGRCRSRQGRVGRDG